MKVAHLFAGLAVSDLDKALAWYEAFFGRPADMRPNDDEAVWQASAGSAIYLVVDAKRAGHGRVLYIVGELASTVEEIADRGIEPVGSEAVPGAGQKASFEDPDGNFVVLAELTGSGDSPA